MSRLGRDEQRDHEGAGRSADRAVTPIDVRVPAAGAGARSASVDGATVVAAPGEEIQNAVLNHLHRLALAAGHPVLATIHDRRVGYSVPLRVDPDGASHLAADPVPTPAEEEPAVPAATPVPEETPVPERAATGWDRPTHVLRSLEAVPDGAPAFASAAVPDERRTPAAGSAPTFVLRALPEPAGGVRPGTVAPPTGVFGPPPRMGDAAAAPAPAPEEAAPRTAPPADPEPAHTRAPEPPREPAPAQPHELTARPEPSSCPTPLPEPTPLPDPAAAPKPVTASKRPSAPGPFLDADPGPKPTPTPARGFDAVAEAVLGDALLTVPGDATTAALLAEPTARINEAVREGRTQTAAHLAEQVVTDASRTLGPEHPEVLRLRELTAYIAYLSGDPGRAFDLSLELARLHRRAGDAEAAYGNVQSAATAWRAVRDPEQGLELGRDLVGLWDELAAEEGPAAEDAEELESVRTRMGRLAERLRTRAG
ncbi:tetratricopeptide repeat protein [Streptomyces olivaceus]|uniref:tetratricopeptide repeat protein n=1 Tax=Streptomyces olivaceus TaxID=47716 RepID=UPI00369DEC8E